MMRPESVLAKRWVSLAAPRQRVWNQGKSHFTTIYVSSFGTFYPKPLTSEHAHLPEDTFTYGKSTRQSVDDLLCFLSPGCPPPLGKVYECDNTSTAILTVAPGGSGSQQPARLCLPIGMLGSGSVQCSQSQQLKLGARGTATAALSIFPVMASDKHPCSSFHQQHCA
ncbi:hypothetical protein Q8A73_015483 [Channa argus]|nr:hypothetical protein Q8A73_015483 [Channa argus]